MDVVSLKAYLQYLLANNYFDTDENGLAIKQYNKFLQTLSRLPFSRAVNFFNYVQDTFNKLGLVCINQDDDDKGMAYLLKSKKLYEKLVEILTANPINCYNTVDEYNLELKNFSKATPEELATAIKFRQFKPYLEGDKQIETVFRFFYQGGLNIKKTEDFYTLTTFYLAQANVKSGDKDKAAEWCGVTL
jgi:tetratricopeptide (TPR) repeat protein